MQLNLAQLLCLVTQSSTYTVGVWAKLRGPDIGANQFYSTFPLCVENRTLDKNHTRHNEEIHLKFCSSRQVGISYNKSLIHP